MLKRNRKRLLWALPALILLAVGLYFVPAVYNRLSWRLEEARARIKYFFNPPSEAVFQPGAAPSLSLEDAILTARAEMNLTLTPPPTSTPAPTLAATVAPTATFPPVPPSVVLENVTYVDQRNRWNYCGPANLTMALNFWGWKGDRDDVARVIKPGTGDKRKSFIEQGEPDKNVMPYEMANFVNEETEFRALIRHGGDINLLKRLIAAGFPPVVEKGYYERDANGKISWLGHYLFTTGYDDARGGFIVQDAYLKPGKNLLSEYDAYQEGWLAFNYLFLVVYPPEREAELYQTLGPWADEAWANQRALDLAERDIAALRGDDLFFAWFNKGTSLVQLRAYAAAAAAYDQAFALYAAWDVKEKDRPYRMMWYQTGPYFAYYYSGRYQDVVNLANVTLNDTIAKPTLEESLLWRGRAYERLGQTQLAIQDYRAALGVHVGWLPALQALQEIGATP